MIWSLKQRIDFLIGNEKQTFHRSCKQEQSTIITMSINVVQELERNKQTIYDSIKIGEQSLDEVLNRYEKLLTSIIETGNMNLAEKLMSLMNWLSDYTVNYRLED